MTVSIAFDSLEKGQEILEFAPGVDSGEMSGPTEVVVW